MIAPLLMIVIAAFFSQMCSAGTSITVSSAYKKELNVKIQGTGIGGCDVILQPGQTDSADCWCLWGTINYSFCAYTKTGTTSDKPVIADNSTVAQGKCPIVTGESLVCSDLASLGNCYDKAYSCSVDATGLCHCATV